MDTTNTAIVWETDLGLPLIHRGKVRDIYAVGEDKLLLVTSDRLSAFDVVLPTPIPYKGRVLNQISIFWFKEFERIIENHIVTADVSDMGFDEDFLRKFADILNGRAVLVHRAKPLPVECVIRGFLTGSGWKDYQKTGAVCGHALPRGLRQGQELPDPLFTPSTKASVGHDINIGFRDVISLIGEDLAVQVRELSMRIYKEGVALARTKGILIADTKFEFGIYNGRLMLIDEVLTPDSSRFWPAATYRLDQDQPSLDKQIVRDFLETLPWDKNPPGPVLPPDIVARTTEAYQAVFHQLTGLCLE